MTILSIKQHPIGFKPDFGSTVTILTTAVADTKHCRRVSGQGIFTGVVLEESELRLKRSPKHVSISVEGVEEFQHEPENVETNCCWHEHKLKDKLKDYEEYKPHCEKDHGGEERKKQEFVILSLTCPSFPFSPGQIVWISLDQIIALSVICKN